MKSYIIKIELEESNPVIWRRVIMPAGATYRRLHDVIQKVTNFQSGYPDSGYHLYEFELPEENRIVTDNEEAYLEHQHYVKNKKYYEERLKTMPENMLEFEKNYQQRLKIDVRKPTGLKIEDYLEKHKEIRYNYDFGDNWWFTIRLEEIVEDYYFGYPTLLDGAESAPPEDVGGIHGFYEFLEAYRDPKHPGHESMKDWVGEWGFREYDPNWINDRLKCLDYKKTEWDKIKHERYIVIEDKYRKSR
ncbi:MAG: plasmid pRiA4b ORF-3 family protein [Acidaminobacter sp.]|uniref:plasmid pRiA4b ORF-3 family protein n=1 Tax=Acidaminobacter sp. TaxID=1872102 RepID=UPI00137E5ABC|nr:plasmid pRiA4b ORF-3 family protein [Acidaminobacter sp.]MZQ99307.1 plasmid pRiA4b ORF-3 family protein [Acidaminobacter sp.]